jgi:uncharacterized protein YacL
MNEFSIDSNILERNEKFLKRFEILSHLGMFSINVVALELSLATGKIKYLFISFCQMMLSVLLACIGFFYIFLRLKQQSEIQNLNQVPKAAAFNKKRTNALKRKALYSAIFIFIVLVIALAFGVTRFRNLLWNKAISDIYKLNDNEVDILNFILFISVVVIELSLVVSLE